MSISLQPLIRDVASSTCEKLLDMREKISQEVLEEAERVKDLSIPQRERFEVAETLVSKGFEKFDKEASNAFQAPPWSDIKTMFLNTSRNKYFFSSLELLGKVTRVLSGENAHEDHPSTIDWVW